MDDVSYRPYTERDQLLQNESGGSDTGSRSESPTHNTDALDDGFRGKRIDDGSLNYEEAISRTGYGKFHYLLLALCGWALSSDAIEVLSISFVLPPATCELNLSSADKGWLTAIIFAGMMVGSYLWGTLADIYGRRQVLLYSLTVNGLGGLSSSFAQQFPVFLFFRFISGIGVGGSLPVIFAYYTEFQPKEKRGAMISLLATFWMCGNIVAAALAWIIIPHYEFGVHRGSFTFDSWRLYLAICTIPCISSGLAFIFMPESPKYLLESGQTEKAILALKKIFKRNNPSKNVHTDFQISTLQSSISIQRTGSDYTRPTCCTRFTSAFKQFFSSVVQLYKSPLTSVSVTMTIIYFTLSFGYYGMFLWFPELFNRIEKYGGSPCNLGHANNSDTNTTVPCDGTVPNSIYFESFLTAISNLPANIFTIFLIDRIGRKLLLSTSMVISGLSVFLIATLNNKTQSLVMSCVFGGISTVGWNALDVISVEVFPTHLRSTATGVTMGVGRLAAILGNLVFGELVDVYCLVPMFMVASLLTIGGLSVIKLPPITANMDLQ